MNGIDEIRDHLCATVCAFGNARRRRTSRRSWRNEEVEERKEGVSCRDGRSPVSK